jgi:hypothetical protein
MHFIAAATPGIHAGKSHPPPFPGSLFASRTGSRTDIDAATAVLTISSRFFPLSSTYSIGYLPALAGPARMACPHCALLPVSLPELDTT